MTSHKSSKKTGRSAPTASAPAGEKPIVLTVTVLPATDGGKRKVIASGAPDGEMPVVRTGVFAERHALLDAVFAEILQRKPQVVAEKHRQAKNDAAAVTPSTPRDAAPEDELAGPARAPIEATTDSLPQAPTELPEIEGDPPGQGVQLVAFPPDEAAAEELLTSPQEEPHA